MSTTRSKPGGTKTAIDWGEVRRHLDGARRLVEQAWAPAPDEARRILKARAESLAREPEPAQPVAAQLEVVEFLLAHERYAVESRYVREVYPLESITPLPCTPAFVLGIVNLHGEMLSVVDIKKLFDLPEKGLTDLNKVIVLEFGAMYLGILADVIAGVRRIPTDAIQPSLPTLTGIREDYLKGVTAERSVILDVEALLTDAAIVVREQVEG